MTKINFDGKKFALIENSRNGEVNSDTIFEYKQEGSLVTANYYGGTVNYGKIIAHLKNNRLDMLYQCLTTDNQLKAGKAIAKISITDGKIKLSLDWEWISVNGGSGQSEYIEL